MKRIPLKILAIFAVLVVSATFVNTEAQRRGRRAQVCGDPTVACVVKDIVFQPYDLQFRVSPNAVIWESELFYAVILMSLNATENCEFHVSEDERSKAQELFPNNKVFTDRCGEPGNLFYSNTDSHYRFMAVYAGRTRAQAARMLAKVKATGKYPTANIRRMYAGFNGT